MNIALVGAGRGAIALGVLWERAGHTVVAASGRSGATRERVATHLPAAAWVPAIDLASLPAADLFLIGAPDDAIELLAHSLADGAASWLNDATVAHLSGALGTEPLAAAIEAGARALCIHPLQTLPTVDAAIERLPGSAVAVTADDDLAIEIGEQLASDAGARPFVIAPDAKPLYHAAAVFASNYVVAVIAEAERLFADAGVTDAADAFMPLVRATIRNVDELGAGDALTGPAARGDAGTVERNLEALKVSAPDAVATYVELAGLALDLAGRAGRLQPGARAAVEEVLARWR